jgi:DNA-binding MurR/RpiR family transcriptional regulator
MAVIAAAQTHSDLTRIHIDMDISPFWRLFGGHAGNPAIMENDGQGILRSRRIALPRARAGGLVAVGDLREAAGLVERIRRRAGALSASFRRIGDYVLAHPYDLAFFPAARVAAEVGVSESAVVRFAIALGYAGYPQMQQAAQTYVRGLATPSSRLASRPITKLSTLPDILRAVVLQDVKNLQDTATDPTVHAFGAVAEALLDAQRIYIAGVRGLSHLAGLLAFLLDMCGYETVPLLHGSAADFQTARRMRRGDVFVAFAFLRYTRRTVDLVRLARDRGVRTIVITDSLTSPPSREADHVLCTAVATQSFHNSYVSAVSYINAIVTAIATKARDRTTRSLRDIDAIVPLEEFDIG